MPEKIDERDLYRFVQGDCDPATKEFIQQQRAIAGSPVAQWFDEIEKAMSSDSLVTIPWASVAVDPQSEVQPSVIPATEDPDQPGLPVNSKTASTKWPLVPTIAATALVTLGLSWVLVAIFSDNGDGAQLAFNSFAPTVAESRSSEIVELRKVNGVYQSIKPFYVDVEVPQPCYLTILHFDPQQQLRIYPFQGTIRADSNQPFSQLIQSPGTGQHSFVAFLTTDARATAVIRNSAQSQSASKDAIKVRERVRAKLRIGKHDFTEREFIVQKKLPQ